MATSSCPNRRKEKKKWWLSKRKIAENYVREARCLIATRNHSDIVLAINILDSALVLSPRLDLAMELKARSLIYLRRFKEIADMLQDDIPSVRFDCDDDSSMSSESVSSQMPLAIERTDQSSFICLPISDLKKRIFAGLSKSSGGKEGQWRYLVLGQACFHLGLMEDCMLLLLTRKRLAAEAFRQESISWTEDNFSLSVLQTYVGNSQKPPLPPKTESETISQLLSNVRVLIRRKTAGIAALDAGQHSEAVRHFTKLVEGRRITAQGFLIFVECYVHRASAYKSLGRIAEAIADCNKTLALDSASIGALTIRASLYETIGCFTESIHDQEQMKLLYNSIMRDGRLPGPVWKPQTVQAREVPGKLHCLSTKIQQLKQRVSPVEESVDYYGLMGLKKGECSRPEIERAQLLLSLRHKPDKAIEFLDRVELAEEGERESVWDRAKTSALWLYRLIQKGYTSIINELEAVKMKEKEKERNPSTHCLQQALTATTTQNPEPMFEPVTEIKQRISTKPPPTILQGGFCRDVGNLISESAGFNRPYEALSC